MANIHFTNTDFDFTTLQALTPSPITGGTHLSKFRVHTSNHDSTPFYVQLPKCKTEQGIIKLNGGKRHCCDLVFTHEDEEFLVWIERLEDYCRKILYDNRQKWFSNDLNETDIESLFIYSLKCKRNRRILRVNVPTLNNMCSLKIFDENQAEVSHETITDKSTIIPCIEVQGIKCSGATFSLEFEVKQLLLISPFEETFQQKCMIEAPATLAKTVREPEIKEEKEEESKKEEIVQEIQEIEDLTISDELQEVDLGLDSIDTTTPFQIKKRNDLYYEMYREAKRKARLARDLAVSSYLEAKRIKNTFLLNTNIGGGGVGGDESDLDDSEYTDTGLRGN